MFFYQRFIPGLAIYSYIVGDEQTQTAAVIDPTRDVEEYLDIAEREGVHVRMFWKPLYMPTSSAGRTS